MPQLYELNLRDYWNIFLKRKGIVFIAFLAVFLSIFIYTSFQTPIYEASVLIKIDPYLGAPTEMIFPGGGERYWGPPSGELSDYSKQIASRPILETAAEELGWLTDDLNKKEKNQIISGINSQISVTELWAKEKTNMIRLNVQGPDPQRATDLANKISQVFKKVNAEQKNQRVRNVREFIENTLNDVSKKLKEQEERQRTLTTQGAVGAGVNIVEQIYEIEKKRTDLSTRFTEIHPDVIRLDEQIDDLKRELKSLPKEEFEYGILKRDIAINEKLYTSLKERLQEAQIKEAEKVDNVILVNPAIAPTKPFYPNKRKNYMVGMILGLFLGVTTALITEHLDTSIGRVEDVENFVKVNVVGIIPYCIEKRKEGEKVEKRWHRIFFKKKPPKKRLYEEAPIFEVEQHYSSIFLEAFRILSVNLQVMFGEGGRITHKIIIITSCNPEEGKTVITSNLGIVLAQMGYKILIVDTDTRRANIHKVFGLKKKEGGLLDILTGKVSADSAVRTATDLILGATGVERIMDKPWLNNLNILTSGSVFPSPINLFNSDKMNETLNYFKNSYDIVLLDSSPILAVSEPSIIIPKTDGVLLVYKAGATSRLALRRAKIQIESVKGKGALSGVILNNVTPEIGMDTYYYYSRKYYGEKKRPGDREEGGGDHV
jgi:tyrosine-protein kinase Etk/Wzc